MSSIKKLKILIPNIKIIFILRNQLDLIKSLYLQYVKSGGIKKISQYFITSKNNLADIKVIHDISSIHEYSLNYYNIIKYLKEEFSIQNIEILIYEEIKNNLKEEFCNVIGLKSKHEIVENRKKLINRSLSNFEYKMLIFFNNFFRSKYNNTRLALIKQKHLFNLINSIDNKLNLFDSYIIPKELENEWSKKYNKSNNQIVSEFNILLPSNYID